MALTFQIAILWCILPFMAPGISSKETKFTKRTLVMTSTLLVTVANPDVEVRGGGGGYFACLAGVSSFSDFFFFTQNRGG